MTSQAEAWRTCGTTLDDLLIDLQDESRDRDERLQHAITLLRMVRTSAAHFERYLTDAATGAERSR